MNRTIGLSAIAAIALFVLAGCGGGGGEAPPPGTVASPTFNPLPGNYESAQSVTISTTTPGASIRYTTDGSTPTSTTGTPYVDPFLISATTTVKAVAYLAGWNDSPVVEAGYVIIYTVDAATGNDTTGDGVTIPYRTITKALSVAGYGDNVTVAPGTYDNVLGETFPIVIPAGVKLIGDEANKGNGPTPTLIRGGDNVAAYNVLYSIALYPLDNTTISGFTIHNDCTVVLFPLAIAMTFDGVTVKNNRIVDVQTAGTNSSGVYVDGGGADSVISGNEIRNRFAGIAFVGGAGDGTRVENNVITQNSIGVEYDFPAASGDLGGGSAGSVGGNVIAGNEIMDLATSCTSGTVISAKDNMWDHVPPTISAVADGSDIFNPNGATIVTTGALPAP